MTISSVWEADPSHKERSILDFTKKAQLLSGQVNKIQMMQPLHTFKFSTIAKLFFGKGKKNFFVREKSLPYTEEVFKSEDLFLASMPQISVHFCVTQVHRPVVFLDSELVSASCYQQSMLLWGLHINHWNYSGGGRWWWRRNIHMLHQMLVNYFYAFLSWFLACWITELN